MLADTITYYSNEGVQLELVKQLAFRELAFANVDAGALFRDCVGYNKPLLLSSFSAFRLFDKKSKVYQPYCRLALPDMVAREWINWVKNHYRNNIHDEHLQGYLNTFVFHFNQPGKAELPEYFRWIIENIWKQKDREN